MVQTLPHFASYFLFSSFSLFFLAIALFSSKASSLMRSFSRNRSIESPLVSFLLPLLPLPLAPLSTSFFNSTSFASASSFFALPSSFWVVFKVFDVVFSLAVAAS
jgi:hypothetical protein